MRASEKRHLSRLSSLRCGNCGEPSDTIHHIRQGQGMAQRAPHWLAISLCHECHQGDHGIHGDRQRWHATKESELTVLARQLEVLYGG